MEAAKHYGRAHSGAPQTFEFDAVFGPAAPQEDVFSDTVRPLLPQFVLRGTDVCVFAYGQTGSGKTYTMSGKRRDERGGVGGRAAAAADASAPRDAAAAGSGGRRKPNFTVDLWSPTRPALTAAELLASDANLSPEPLGWGVPAADGLDPGETQTHSPSGRLAGKSAREAAAVDDDEWTGVNMRALREAFAVAADDVSSGAAYAFAVEYVEIYNETVRFAASLLSLSLFLLK